MNPINPVSHSPLTQSDIARLPNNPVNTSGTSAIPMVQDEFVPQKKSSTLKKVVFGLVAAAAVIVGLKHWGQNSFLKVANDAKNIKWYDYIKKGVVKTADYIEKPFVATYKWIKGLISKDGAKAAEQTSKGAKRAKTSGTPKA